MKTTDSVMREFWDRVIEVAPDDIKEGQSVKLVSDKDIEWLLAEARRAWVEEMRGKILYYLTTDSETHDARRKDFNQAIFDAKDGYAIYHGTGLGMVMEKVDRALKDLLTGDNPERKV